MYKKSQQEIAGFVLIVVLVVIISFVFLVLSLKNNSEPKESIEAKNMISSIMATTTDCAINFEPQYDDFEDLFKDCDKGKTCSNLKKTACEYLQESLKDVLESLVETEASIGAYEAGFLRRDSEGEEGIFRISNGNCSTGNIISSQRTIISQSNSLIFRLSLCKNY